jgi:hypothetical protein
MNRNWSGSTSAYSDGRPLQSSITKCSCSWECIKLLEHRVEASVLSPSWLSCFKRSWGGHEVGFQIVTLESLCTTTSKVEDPIKLAQWQVASLIRIFEGGYSWRICHARWQVTWLKNTSRNVGSEDVDINCGLGRNELLRQETAREYALK